MVESVTLEDIFAFAQENGFTTLAFAGESDTSFLDFESAEKTLIIFGNEARGLPELPEAALRVSIPMKGHSESLNVASAAAIAMFHIGINNG